MVIFLLYICIILSWVFSYSWRLQSHFITPSITVPICKKMLSINLQSRENIASDIEDSSATHSDEGWLMELNEENVEGVFDLIRPQLSSDGGGINLCKIVENEVFVKLTGSCIGCPYRSTTLKEVIENNLVKFLKSPNGIPISVKVVENDI